jgi:hypothetical protein
VAVLAGTGVAAPAPSAAAPAPAITAGAARLINDALASWSQKSTPADPQYFQDGVWHSTYTQIWAYIQGGPPQGAAALWRYSGGTRGDLLLEARSTIDHAIAANQLADGSFTAPSTDTQPAPIRTMMFLVQEESTYLALAPALDATTRARWQASITAAADYLVKSGALTWYFNGNINLGFAEVFYLASRITGAPRFAQDYGAEITFVETPPKPRWAGYGLVITKQPTNPDGTDGSGYLSESGGFDAEYTATQLDGATHLYTLSHDKRLLKLMNLELNQLRPRISSTFQLDTSGGTRHPQIGRTVPFTSSAPAVLAGVDRPDLASMALSQWPYTNATYRGTFTYTNPSFYKGIGDQVGAILLDAMVGNGTMVLTGDGTPAAAPRPAATQGPASSAPKATTSTATASAAPAVRAVVAEGISVRSLATGRRSAHGGHSKAKRHRRRASRHRHVRHGRGRRAHRPALTRPGWQTAPR